MLDSSVLLHKVYRMNVYFGPVKHTNKHPLEKEQESTEWAKK